MAGLLIRGLHLSAAKRLRATAGGCHMAPRWLRDRIGPFPRKTGTAMRKTLPAVALLTLALAACQPQAPSTPATDRSEEHTSELQSLMRISYAVFCLKKKKKLRT